MLFLSAGTFCFFVILNFVNFQAFSPIPSHIFPNISFVQTRYNFIVLTLLSSPISHFCFCTLCLFSFHFTRWISILDCLMANVHCFAGHFFAIRVFCRHVYVGPFNKQRRRNFFDERSCSVSFLNEGNAFCKHETLSLCVPVMSIIQFNENSYEAARLHVRATRGILLLKNASGICSYTSVL